MNLLNVTWDAPIAEIEISAYEVDLLRSSAENHYDMVCRHAMIPGPQAWLNGWYTSFRVTPRPITIKVSGNFRTFDTAAKILEIPAPGECDEQVRDRVGLRMAFRKVLLEMNGFVYKERERMKIEETPTPELEGCFPVVLYFGDDRDRAEFIEAVKVAKPGLRLKAFGK